MCFIALELCSVYFSLSRVALEFAFFCGLCRTLFACIKCEFAISRWIRMVLG